MQKFTKELERMKKEMKEKEMKLREKFREKIEGLIEIIADRKGWEFLQNFKFRCNSR